MVSRSFMRRATLLAVLPMLALGVFAGMATAQDRATGLRIDSNRPVEIEGDKLEVMEDQSMAVFDGNVRVSQGNTVLRTGRLVIHYAGGSAASGSITGGGSSIERLEASRGVNIQSETQVATGDTGTFDMASEVLVLSGKRVTLTEGGNVATGCKLTVSMKTGRATLSGCGGSGGRPTILLQPSSKN